LHDSWKSFKNLEGRDVFTPYRKLFQQKAFMDIKFYIYFLKLSETELSKIILETSKLIILLEVIAYADTSDLCDLKKKRLKY